MVFSCECRATETDALLGWVVSESPIGPEGGLFKIEDKTFAIGAIGSHDKPISLFIYVPNDQVVWLGDYEKFRKFGAK